MDAHHDRHQAENRYTLRGFLAGAFITSVGWIALLQFVGGNP